MTSGGFGYASASVTYHAADYGTNYAFALALHTARVTAFLRATYKASVLSGGATFSSDKWTSIHFTDYGSSRAELSINVEYDPDGHPGDTVPVYIQDVFGSSETSYPAFVTVFENPDSGSQFSITTAKGYHNNSSYVGTPSRGMYIPLDRCLSNGYLQKLPMAFAHAFAANGFSAVNSSGDIDDGDYPATLGELPQMPSYGLYGSTSAGTFSTSGDTSVIKSPVEGVTYQFGYSVKGLVIEGFYRLSSYASTTGASWDISGQIFDGDPGWDEDAGTFSGTCFGYYAPSINNFQCYSNRALSDVVQFFGVFANVDALNSAQKSYMQAVRANGAGVQCFAASSPGYLPMRSASTIGDKLVWSTGCLAWSANAGYDSIRSLPSIDGQGNTVKGFFRDDVLRFVSVFATRLGGTTYQGGNFISMNCGQNSGFELGVLLGWDGSNSNDIL